MSWVTLITMRNGLPLAPLPIDRPKPYAEYHRLLRDRATRTTQLLCNLRRREPRFRKSPQILHIVFRPRTNNPTLLLRHHYSLEKSAHCTDSAQSALVSCGFLSAATSQRVDCGFERDVGGGPRG